MTNLEIRPPAEPPAAGDCIVMRLPEGEPVPAGWTAVDGDRCWRYASEHESWPPPFPWAVFRRTGPVRCWL